MDLISRQAALRTFGLSEKSRKYGGDHSGYQTIMLYEVQDALEALPSEPRWIPVSERLPEESGRYLVTRGLNACGSLWNRIYIANYSDLMGIKSKRIWWQGNVGKSDFERLGDVLAWMPLPKPYEEESDEGE